MSFHMLRAGSTENRRALSRAVTRSLDLLVVGAPIGMQRIERVDRQLARGDVWEPPRSQAGGLVSGTVELHEIPYAGVGRDVGIGPDELSSFLSRDVSELSTDTGGGFAGGAHSR